MAGRLIGNHHHQPGVLGGGEGKEFNLHKKGMGGVGYKNGGVRERRRRGRPGHAAGGKRPQGDLVVLFGGGVPAAAADGGEPLLPGVKLPAELTCTWDLSCVQGCDVVVMATPLLRGAGHGGADQGTSSPRRPSWSRCPRASKGDLPAHDRDHPPGHRGPLPCGGPLRPLPRRGGGPAGTHRRGLRLPRPGGGGEDPGHLPERPLPGLRHQRRGGGWSWGPP